MMKNFTYHILSFVIICLMGFITGSCSDKILTEPQNLQKIEDFKIYGNIHNQLLTFAKGNFVITKSALSDEQKFNQLAQFQINYVKNLTLDETAKNLLIQGISRNKHWYKIENISKESIVVTKNGNNTLYNQIQELFNNNQIDEFEYDSLISLSNAVKDNYSGKLSLDEMHTIIDNLIKQWENQKYSNDSQYGRMLALALSIAKSSAEWWTENPDIALQTKALPAWIGVDAAGALVSGCVALSYQCTQESINWEAVGWASAGGAVSSSTGLVGKIGKWISGLF